MLMHAQSAIFRSAPQSWRRNQGRKIKNLGKNGLFNEQFLHTVSSQIDLFAFLKKSVFSKTSID